MLELYVYMLYALLNAHTTHTNDWFAAYLPGKPECDSFRKTKLGY